MTIFNGANDSPRVARPTPDTFPVTYGEQTVQVTTDSTVASTVNDANISTFTAGTTENRFVIDAPLQRSISCTGNGSVSGNVVSRVADGDATIAVDVRYMKKGKRVRFARTTGAPIQSFVSWVNGSLAQKASEGVDDRLSGGTFAQYSTYTPGTPFYQRNSSAWASDINLTCIPANAPGVLITPKHLLTVTHFPVSGDIHFVADDSSLHAAERDSIAEVPGIPDLSVVTLVDEVDGDIVPATLAPANIASYLPSPQWNVPAFCSNQSRQCVIKDINLWNGDLVGFREPVDSARLSFAAPTISGDSGSPVFFIVNGTAILVTLWSVVSGGISVGSIPSRALSAINAITSPYTVSTSPLTGFPTY